MVSTCRPVPLSASGVLWSQEGCYTHCSVLRSTLHSVCTKLTEDVRELILKLKQCSYEEFEKDGPISDSLSLSSLKVHTYVCTSCIHMSILTVHMCPLI